ncbi:transglycosylase family protein [Streptomyces ficellus]|uniref:Transglycosylase family protein n=1 Tax=Streptomyces ficellus TaxID=1977088 RepID=A0ABT7Z1J1_9ACTN|nr:transglycosylase family protein [Streptomyces ficellus]MDN3293127.1 transglycosylase family protein [Streptomyces ficellus]
MTGSAIALPLLGAGSASAADAATWDKVAECESGGMWSADLGNGFYGGLQMSQETWESYGGLAHAPRPDLASRGEQIDVAEKVYAATGVKTWETCAPIAGLGGATETSGPALGLTPTETAPTAPEPTRSTDPAAPSGLPDVLEAPEAPAASAPAGAGAPAGTAPASPAPAGGPATGTGKHRGETAPEETPATEPGSPGSPGAPGSSGTPGTSGAPYDPAAPQGGGATGAGEAGTGRETGDRPSRGDGATRDPGAVEPGAYTVRPGDSLWVIADEQQVPGGWSALYEANREAVGADPDLILPGQSLDLTAAQE